MLLGNAGAGVGDPDVDRSILELVANPDLAACRGVCHGIIEQVYQQLHDQILVGDERGRFESIAQPDTGTFSRLAVLIEHGLKRCVQCERLLLDRERAGF